MSDRFVASSPSQDTLSATDSFEIADSRDEPDYDRLVRGRACLCRARVRRRE
jgi:hypothetical protein